MKLIILKGLQASGKSTWAREYCSKNKDWIRINRDDLRNMRGEYWVPKQEKLITKWENNCIKSGLEMGYNVILDATNLNQDRNKERVKSLMVDFPDLKVEYNVFEVDLEECIRRDLLRPNSVGEKVIKNTYNKYLAPTKTDFQQDKSLPPCVIFDVDGTLAKMNGRSPYDWSRVGEDLVKESIADMARMFYQSKRVIIFTGRDGSCLETTKSWLARYNIPYHDIFIRPAGNTEKDSVIKKRMFKEHIEGKYYCELIIDDRDQVVKMWREELGLTCLQVDYGDF